MRRSTGAAAACWNAWTDCDAIPMPEPLLPCIAAAIPRSRNPSGGFSRHPLGRSRRRMSLPYPDQANTDLLERIPLSARVVLDVGCNTGALGMAYRRLNPRARLLGIEQDPAAADLARQRLDEVAVVDVEQN